MIDKALTVWPTRQEIGTRFQFLLRLFRRRIPSMPLWWADEFTKVLAGAARGPVLDFEMRCEMTKLAQQLAHIRKESEYARR